MRFVKCIKTGKRIFCWLLFFALIAGQSVSLVYGDDGESFGNIQKAAANENEVPYAVDEVVVDNIKYQIINGYAKVAGEQDHTLPWGDIVLPDKVSYNGNTYSVVSIEDNAFQRCSYLTSMEIPDSVISIGNNAFKSCYQMQKVKLPENLQSIGDRAFDTCKSLEEVKLPENLQTIGDYAFEQCDSLMKVEIPDSVTSVGKWAFDRCGSLTEVKLPSNLQIIEEGTFCCCRNLIKVEIPSSVMSIGADAFEQCEKMEEIKLPLNLQTIGEEAFQSCSQLRGVEIPDSVTDIGKAAFFECYSLEEVKLSQNLRTIEQATFESCSKLKKIEIPDSITSIEGYAFMLCSSLEEVTLPSNLQIIKMNAFAYTSLIEEIEVPDSVKTMGRCAFAYNNKLKTAKIPDHVSINIAFLECSSLETLQIKVKIKDGVVTPVENASGMDGFSYSGTVKLNRKLEFWTEDGSAKLTGAEFEAARKAYLAVEDGDTDDNFWYGWEVVPEGPLVYEVTVAVNKDGEPWADHDRTFKLTKDNGSSFIDNLSCVIEGTYQIYDFTDTASGMDTEVTVEVNKSNVTSNPVDYYTVTFYDGADNPYGEDTRQKPQIVLSGIKAEKPADPEKANYRFVGWMNDEKGETVFDFDRKIIGTTSIYAKWIENPIKYQHTITASAGEGGSISPRGSVVVDDGKNQEFLIVPDEGYEILSVKVDGIEQGAKGTYTFTNVTENHNINAEFIKKDSGEINPTEPVNPENPTEPTQPENPTEPVNPENPTEPTSPENPTEPTSPEPSTEPVNPENPTEPTQPEAPTSPDSQGTPGDSDSADDTDISHTPTNSGSTSGNTNSSKKDNEPVTSGLSHTDMYATIAMIAGISYLLLYFIEKKQGMSEEKKNKLIASLIAWAKDGAGSQKGVKRVIALVLIVLILFYYHSIGKKISLEWQSVN